MSLRRKGSNISSMPSPTGKGSRENVWPPPPPAGESELERAVRVEEEREAKRVSDAIDRALEVERAALKKRQKSEIRLLLLGEYSLSSSCFCLWGARTWARRRVSEPQGGLLTSELGTGMDASAVAFGSKARLCHSVAHAVAIYLIFVFPAALEKAWLSLVPVSVIL